MVSEAQTNSSNTRFRNLGFGLLAGFVPLAVLIGMLLISLAVTWLARFLLSGASFEVAQSTLPLVFAACLLTSLIVFVVMTVRVLRRVRQWQMAGEAERAVGSLWALALTSVLILLPFVLAFALPQSPAVAR